MECDKDLFHKIKQLIEEENKKQTEIITQNINREILLIRKELQDEIVKTENITTEVNSLSKKYNNLEKTNRQNNIIIYNANFQTGDLTDFTVNLINYYLGLRISSDSVNNIYLLGKKQENPPILVKFISNLTKRKIFNSCSKLKGSDITISEDLSQEEREERKTLVQYLKEAKAVNLKSHIKGSRLYVNSKAYTIDDLFPGIRFGETEVTLPQTSEKTKAEERTNNKAQVTRSSARLQQNQQPNKKTTE